MFIFIPYHNQEEHTVKKFLSKHTDKIKGHLSCFDRILLKGYLPISSGTSMGSFMDYMKWLRKDFKTIVQRYSEEVKGYAKQMAEKKRRPYIHLSQPLKKDVFVRSMARDDNVQNGLICILSAVEACMSFRMIPGKGRPSIINAKRKCLCLYFYFLDRNLGFYHIRLQTWFPFTIQICMNGHEYLARKMDELGMDYRQVDNCFTYLADIKRAQRLAKNFVRPNWPRVLSALARRVNPLLSTIFSRMDYYWVIEQAEYATDVMFESGHHLKGLYEKLLRHACLCFSAEDVLTFLGRKMTGHFQGEVGNHYKKRWPGARIRHRMKKNWIKMYNKCASVVRVETVINCPYEFKVWRHGCRKGKKGMNWFPMIKGIGYLFRYAEVSLRANSNFLDALSVVNDPEESMESMRVLSRRIKRSGRSYRGFNPAEKRDVRLFQAVMRGEHLIDGFRNADIWRQLYGKARDGKERRRQGARVSRLLKLLHVHRLIAKIPRSRRWKVTQKGQKIMSTVIILFEDVFPETMIEKAA